MPRGLYAGTLLLGCVLIAAACSSGGTDPVLGQPINTAIQQVRLGSTIIDFEGLNLSYLPGIDRIRMDVDREVDITQVRDSIAINLQLIGADGDFRQYNRQDLMNNGRLELISSELGIVDWVSNSGSLDPTGSPLHPGVNYRVRISSFYTKISHKVRDDIGMSSQEFDLLPLSRPREGFFTQLQSDGLIRRILLGSRAVNRNDSLHTLVPLDKVESVTVELNSPLTPSSFVPSLVWELVINNLTTGESFSFSTADLFANGNFRFQAEDNSTIIWDKTTPGGLSSFVSSSTGATFTVSNVGDELEFRVDRVTGERANGDSLTLRDRTFRVLHTYS